MKNLARFCLILSCVFGFKKGFSEEEPLHIDYESGYTLDKTYIDHGDVFTVLHINEMSSVEEIDCIIEKILTVNADIACLSFPTTAEFTSAFYEELKNRYAHFYHANLFAENKSLQGDLLIASNFELKEFNFSSFPEENRERESSGFFDFVISKDRESLGHIYILETPLSKSLHVVQKKITNDNVFSTLESASFLLSEAASSDYIIETISTSIENIGNCFLTTVLQNKEFMSRAQSYDIYDLICKDSTKPSQSENDSRTHYDFSVKQDFEENTSSAQGKISYKMDTGRNSDFSIDMRGEVRKNAYGNPTGQIEAGLSGNF